MINLGHESQYPGRDQNQVPPECKARARLELHPVVELKVIVF
jgi:hypothetical protein